MTPRRHVVITGTGRAGTTFLVELLTHLGLETGFSVESAGLKKNNPGHAGLEHDIRHAKCPYIVKSPWFCEYAEDVLGREDVIVEHIFLPIRDLYAAAESRRWVSNTGLSSLSFLGLVRHMLRPKHWLQPKAFPGGLWHTRSSESEAQEHVLLMQLYRLLLAASNSEVPITLLRYPRLTKDSEYLFAKLAPLLQSIDSNSFREVFKRVVRPELVHRFGDKDC